MIKGRSEILTRFLLERAAGVAVPKGDNGPPPAPTPAKSTRDLRKSRSICVQCRVHELDVRGERCGDFMIRFLLERAAGVAVPTWRRRPGAGADLSQIGPANLEIRVMTIEIRTLSADDMRYMNPS